MWDHTLLIEKDDPYLDFFESAAMEGLCALRVMDKMGAESCAKLVYDKFNEVLSKLNVFCISLIWSLASVYAFIVLAYVGACFCIEALTEL